MSITRDLSRYAVCYWMCSLLTAFVLGMDTYFNMEEYKCTAFAVYFVVGGVLFLVGQRFTPLHRPARDAALRWAGAYGAACLLAQIGALDGDNALFGKNGYYMGTLFLLASLVLWYLLRSVGDRQMAQWGIGLFLVAGGVANGLGILNLYGADPLGVVGQLQAFQRGEYFTTIGQMNFVALMMTMWLALAVGTFLFSQQSIRTPANVARLVCCGTGFWGMMLFDSDNYLLGAGALLLGILLAPQFDTRILQRLSLLGVVFFSAAGLGVGLTNYFPTPRKLPLISAAGTPWVSLVGILLSAAALLVLIRWHRSHAPRSLTRPGRWVAGTVVAVCGVVVLWSNWSDSAFLSKYLLFDENWGTHRGACWMALGRIFLSSSPLRVLFGYGPCATHQLLMTHPEAWSGISYDLSGFYAAHNEYLELLMSSGLLGLVTWLGFVGTHLKQAVRKGQDATVTSLALAVFAYAVESVVNIRTCMVFPVLIVLLGLLAAALREEQPEPRPPKQMAREVALVLVLVALTAVCYHLSFA